MRSMSVSGKQQTAANGVFGVVADLTTNSAKIAEEAAKRFASVLQ